MHLQANLLALEYGRANVRGEEVAGCIDQFPYQHKKGRNACSVVGRGAEIQINLIDLDLNSPTCVHETNPSQPCNLGNTAHHLHTLAIGIAITILKILRNPTANSPLSLCVVY